VSFRIASQDLRGGVGHSSAVVVQVDAAVLAQSLGGLIHTRALQVCLGLAAGQHVD